MMKKEIKLLLGGFFLATLGGITSVSIYKSFEKPIVISQTSTLQPKNVKMVNNILTENRPESFEVAAKKSLNAVVHIKTEMIIQQAVNPMYQLFYGGNPYNEQSVKASGSGVIISNNGYIVTNNHVIKNAKNISVTLNNKQTYNAKVIGTDPNTDLALLKIDEKKLPFMDYGNSDNLKVGEWVLAVGNPFNLTSTVTAGIVSAKGRDINILSSDPYTGVSAIESFIQTDAAVNPGNSGGALVNTKGELVGINAAIQSNTGSYTGYSFAIPVNIVKKVVNDLKEYGSVQRAFMGINIRNIDENLANEINIKDLNGVYISSVIANGSADKAGIKKGDIITMIGEVKITNVPELQEQLSQFRPGEKVNISVKRDGKEIEIPVVLTNLEGTSTTLSLEKVNTFKLLGAKFENLTKKKAKKLNIDGGVRVTEIYNGKLRNVGIQKGFIITKVNHKTIKDIDELSDIIKNSSDGVLIEGIYENGRKEYYGFGIK